MELWIRSQDKQFLVKATRLSTVFNEDNSCEIISSFGEHSCDELGTYATKERALEVLDEIQNLLQPKIKYIQEEPVTSIVDFGYQISQNVDMKIQEINRIVYEMPKE